MAWTQADLDKVDDAIKALAAGAIQSFTFAGESYTFMEIDSLLKLRSVIAQGVNAAAGGSAYRLAVTGKGA